MRDLKKDPARGFSVSVDIEADGGALFTERQVGTDHLGRWIDERAADWRPGDMINSSHGIRHIAQIPMVIVHDLMRRGIWHDTPALLRWLNDPDNRAFRIAGGRL